MSNQKNPPVLYIVIPCYNEEKVLPITVDLFLNQLNLLIDKKKIDNSSRIMFVNDGSKDNTWSIIKELSSRNPPILGITLSRNRGHQNALLAGLMEAKSRADITISIDCDGQDDITVMENMVDEYHKGNEIVYGVRNNRDTDTFFKKFTAESFYKLLSVMGCEVVFNHADYRLISSKVLNELSNFKEVNLFLRGLIPLLGFKSTKVFYKRNERMAGDSHYPLKKMLSFSIDGITSLSVKPIMYISMSGLVISLIGIIGILYALISFAFGTTISGWTSMLCLICFLGGFQNLSIGVIGTYIGKIYLESKHRPRFIVSERTFEK
ncbi:MAG: glycosyltransferase family 2 protein [Succinatimonas sp.]|nr:glycosyltransferase family 2 protein [Succinatimonas sp.]